MMGIMIETVVIAFAMGGIVGAITALHLSSNLKKSPAKIERDHRRPRQRTH